MPRFEVPVFNHAEKELEISTNEIRLLIDFDDVNHFVVEELTKLIVAKLNEIPKNEWREAIQRGRGADKWQT
jgi:hypothetical protein